MAIGLQEVTVLKISVVVCTYNRAQLLSACLESICSNLLPDCQLLVIDNGSTDNTKQVVEGFRWPTYVPESRPGHSSARNAGVAASTGDLIVFTDDDVVVDPGWVSATKIRVRQALKTKAGEFVSKYFTIDFPKPDNLKIEPSE